MCPPHASPPGKYFKVYISNLRIEVRPFKPYSIFPDLYENPTETQPLLSILRKEVIQPHLPIQLPCYDFTPVISPAFDGSILKGLATGFGHCRLPWCDGRCVQDPGTYSPRHSDPRLLAIPASCSRVADCSPNWDTIFEVCSPSRDRVSLLCHCSTCVAQAVRGMMI